MLRSYGVRDIRLPSEMRTDAKANHGVANPQLQ